VFTSANGSTRSSTRLGRPGSTRARSRAAVAAIGPRPAALRGAACAPISSRALRRGVVARRVPRTERAGDRVLLAARESARDVLPDGSARRGYAVDVLAVYRTVRPRPTRPTRARARGEVDAITFTSSSDGRQLLRLVGPCPTRSRSSCRSVR
jgi:uroporphyrinogen-III synthase